MHHSLLNTCEGFHLFIFAFDEAACQLLMAAKLQSTTIIPLSALENTLLLEVKPFRTMAEYCWTCTPFTIKYCLETFNLTNCTYLDADLYFYKNPASLITGMGDNSVLITPHNYYSAYDQSATAGIYCVQFITFKDTADGNLVLNWWAGACIKWCHSYYEEGKMGDQKYLDSWPYMFNGVHICKNLNAGIAPWNAINYNTESDIENMIFYHFHDLQHISDGSWFTGGYELPQAIIDRIYRPYIKLLLLIREQNSTINSLNTKNKTTFEILTLKYKVGIYVIDLKAAIKNLFQAMFFTKRRRFYKNNFIK